MIGYEVVICRGNLNINFELMNKSIKYQVAGYFTYEKSNYSHSRIHNLSSHQEVSGPVQLYFKWLLTKLCSKPVNLLIASLLL